MTSTPLPGRLFVVSTPIGNLGDMTYRAVEVLSRVGLILAEDTRHSRRLLDHFEIRTSVDSYHEHNEAKQTPRVLERLRAGTDVALISDAGTPLLSDPGGRLVQAAVEADITVVPVPGASALLSALVAAGIAADRFTFFGFLPRKGKERRETLATLSALEHTAVLYEAPGRVGETLAELASLGPPGRIAAVARELTKQYEEIRRGTVAELAEYYSASPVRGEVVIVVSGRVREPSLSEDVLLERARALRDAGVGTREIVDALIRDHGAPRNLAYRLAHLS